MVIPVYISMIWYGCSFFSTFTNDLAYSLKRKNIGQFNKVNVEYMHIYYIISTLNLLKFDCNWRKNSFIYLSSSSISSSVSCPFIHIFCQLFYHLLMCLSFLYLFIKLFYKVKLLVFYLPCVFCCSCVWVCKFWNLISYIIKYSTYLLASIIVCYHTYTTLSVLKLFIPLSLAFTQILLHVNAYLLT